MRRLLAAAGLILIGLTWQLWTPQVVFPQVPLFRFAVGCPAWVDWLALSLLLAGLVTALVSRHDSRKGAAGLLLFAASTGAMVLLDQHRLQPWAYQFSVAALLLACAPRERALMLLRVATIGIYVHSGLSKLDFAFLETNGQQLVGALLDSVGLSMKFWSQEMRRTAAGMLPLGELLIAAGLAIPRTRRWALYVSVVMHFLLLMALGPWGMNHKPGVLAWNVFFIIQNWLLFGGARETVVKSTSRWRRSFADTMVAAVVLLPLLEPWGWFDHWPSWAVYAAHPAKVQVYVDGARVRDLPSAAQLHIGVKQPFNRWRRVAIDRWSLESLNVPISPQDRFQLGVANALAEFVGASEDVRVVIKGRTDRWTGERSRRELVGRGAISEEANRFLLNTSPRWVVARD